MNYLFLCITIIAILCGNIDAMQPEAPSLARTLVWAMQLTTRLYHLAFLQQEKDSSIIGIGDDGNAYYIRNQKSTTLPLPTKDPITAMSGALADTAIAVAPLPGRYSANPVSVTMIDLHTGSPCATIPLTRHAAAQAITDLAYGPDGTIGTATSDNGYCYIWDKRMSMPVEKIEEQRYPIVAARIDQHDVVNILFRQGMFCSTKLDEALYARTRFDRSFFEQERIIGNAILTSDGSSFLAATATLGQCANLRLLDMTKQEYYTIDGAHGLATGACSRAGDLFASVYHHALTVIKRQQASAHGRSIVQHWPEQETIPALAVCPEGKTMTASTGNNMLKCWDIREQEQ